MPTTNGLKKAGFLVIHLLLMVGFLRCYYPESLQMCTAMHERDMSCHQQSILMLKMSILLLSVSSSPLEKYTAVSCKPPRSIFCALQVQFVAIRTKINELKNWKILLLSVIHRTVMQDAVCPHVLPTKTKVFCK